MDKFLIGWLIVALIVAIFFGCLTVAGRHDRRAPPSMKKIRKAGF